MNPTVFILAIMGAAAVALIVFGLGRRRSTLEDLIQSWDILDDPEAAKKSSPFSGSLSDWLSGRLLGAGLIVEPREALMVWAGVGVIFTGAFLLSSQNILLSLLLGFGAAAFVGVSYLNFQKVRRLRKFEDQMTRALTLLANLLESGRSLPQALAHVAEKTPAPLGAELTWVHRQYTVGVELPDALIAVSNRVDSEEFRFFATAVDMNRTAGADLIGVLKTLSTTLVERNSLRQDLRSKLAEAQLTKYVVGASPVVAGVALSLIAPEQMRPLYTTLSGAVIFALAVGFWLAGMLVTSMMVKRVEI